MAKTPHEILSEVIAATAPHELPLVDGLADLDDHEITAVLTGRTGRRDPVGFGVTEVSVLMSPVVWLVVSEFVKRGTRAVADDVFGRFKGWLRRLRRRAPGQATVPRLTPGQLVLVHSRMIERAGAAGIDDRTAEQLADAVVSALARAADE